MNGDLQMAVGWLLIVLVLAAAAFPVVATYQFVLVAAHFKRNHYRKCAPYFPRTAVLVPAWNEAAVIGHTIDRLMALDYPPQCLRVYLIDDASTDDTPAVVRAKVDQYPGHVVYLRRDHGDRGSPTRSTTGYGPPSRTSGWRPCSSWTPTCSTSRQRSAR